MRRKDTKRKRKKGRTEIEQNDTGRERKGIKSKKRTRRTRVREGESITPEVDALSEVYNDEARRCPTSTAS